MGSSPFWNLIMLEKYRPSGKLSPTTLLMAVPGVLIAALLGVVYVAVLAAVPYVKMCILMCVLAAALVGGAAYLIVNLGKCRNPVAAALIGGTMGFTTWITSFVAMWQYSEPQKGFISYVKWRAETGFTTNTSNQHSGIELYILWGIEGACFIGTGMVVAARRARSPFCEQCLGWAESGKLNFTIERPGKAAVEAVKKAQGVAELVPDPALDAAPGPENSRLIYTVLGCDKCPSVDHVVIRHSQIITSKKKVEERSKKLHQSVLIGPDELEALKAYAEPAP